MAACIRSLTPCLHAASVVKGRFAEEKVLDYVRDIIAAESGANDGLGVSAWLAMTKSILADIASVAVSVHLPGFVLSRPTTCWPFHWM